MLLGQIYLADNNKMCLGLHVKLPIFLLNLNQTRILPTDFRKILKYQISLKSFQWERSAPYGEAEMRTDGWTDKTKFMVSFRNFLKAPNNERFFATAFIQGVQLKRGPSTKP
jgi:hypothetical protein